MDRIRRSLLATAFLLIFLSPVFSQELTVGVVEFEEKNDIGLQNAGRIVAEWVVTELKQLDRFQIAERLLMQQVLEEQELMLSGVIDDEQVVEIGKLYGVDAIVTGSVMKVGDSINITARIVNVGTAEVLKTASGRVVSLNDLEQESYILANNLSDISREEFIVRQAVAEKQNQRLEVGGGIAAGWNNADSGPILLDVFFRYQSPLFGAFINGAPVGGIQNVDIGGNFNVTHYLGLGAMVGMWFDNAIDYVDANYVLFGIVGRPVVAVDFGLFFGGTLGGTVWTEDNNDVKVDGGWGFGNYTVWVQYRVNESYSIMIRAQGVELYDLEDQLPPGYQYPNADYEYRGGKFSIIFNYSFLI